MSFLAAGSQSWSVFHRQQTLSRTRLNAAVANSWCLLLSRTFFGSIIPDTKVQDDTPATRALRQRYPPGPLDASLFEVEADSNSQPLSGHSGNDAPAFVKSEALHNTLPCQVLLRLLSRGDFAGAMTARQELEALHIPINPEPSYARAAIHSLQSLPRSARQKEFFNWWDHTPRPQWRIAFSDVRRTLLLEEPVDFELIMQFSLYCANRGFSTPIGSSLLAPVIRYVDVSITNHFLRDFERAAKENPDEETFEGLNDWMNWRNLAIRTHCIAGRTLLAGNQLEAARAEGIYIEPATYRIVARKLTLAGFLARTHRINHLFLQDHPEDDSTAQPLKPALTDAMARHGISDPLSVTGVATTLRKLKNTIKLERPPPFASFLADFMYHYDSVYKRTRALEILRKHVFGKARPSVCAQWVAAEQLYHSSRGRPVAMLRSFLHYCVPEGIPLEHANSIIEKSGGEMRRGSNLWKAPFPIEKKLWPLKVNLQQAWAALAHLTTDPEALERLYAALLSLCDRAEFLRAEDTEDTPSEGGPPLASPDSGFFQPFIVALGFRVGPQRAALVLADMRRLGLRSTKDNWAALAGIFARNGDTSRVNTILDHIENTWIIDREETPKDRYKSICTYNNIIRGFTEAGLYEAARSVQSRMQARGYLTRWRVNRRTKAIFHRLARYEKGKSDDFLRRRKAVDVAGTRVFADSRALWTPEA